MLAFPNSKLRDYHSQYFRIWGEILTWFLSPNSQFYEHHLLNSPFLLILFLIFCIHFLKKKDMRKKQEITSIITVQMWLCITFAGYPNWIIPFLISYHPSFIISALTNRSVLELYGLSTHLLLSLTVLESSTHYNKFIIVLINIQGKIIPHSF